MCFSFFYTLQLTTKNKRMKRLAVKILLAWVLLLFCENLAIGQTDSISNGFSLVKTMYAQNSQNWYNNLTFKQEVFRVKDDSIVSREVWILAYSSPSKLHIRYSDFDSGRGWLIVTDSIYTYNNFNLIGSRLRIHELMVLGLDIYNVLPQISVERIKQLGIDISRVEMVTIKGKSLYQIGNPETICFWVHTINLLFYGLRKVNESGDVKDTFFEQYKTLYGKPVATEVQYFLNGKMFIFERYSEIRFPTFLHNDLFVPARFKDVMW